MLFYVVACIWFSMVALITTYLKESDWLLHHFDQSESGSKSYAKPRVTCERVWKLYQKQVSKVNLYFVCSHHRKQTVKYECVSNVG